MADDAGLINQVLSETSFLYGGNAAFVEGLHEQWLKDPKSVDVSWQAFFATLPAESGEAKLAWTAKSAPLARPDWLSALDGMWPAVEAKIGAKIASGTTPVAGPSASEADLRKATLDSLHAIMMIRAYRMRGHLRANLDPLHLAVVEGDASELDPANYGFSEADYDRPIFIDFVLGLETSTVREILEIVRRTYCGNVGVQFMHITEPSEKAWLQERIEGKDKEIQFSKEGKVAILKKLIEAEGFELFIHKRFPGTKRFGLDGGEAMVPAMEQIIKRGGALGVKDIIIGMPHRGRLNVLAAVMGKPYKVIFHEFQGGSSLPSDTAGSGDVKYHMGASSDREFDGNNVHLSLTANPSHLEIVNPVVLGKARAKQAITLRDEPDAGRGHVMPLLLHGDAAFAGQGVVAECFTLMGLKGFRTGGTVHFIVNNQIGFTTAPSYSRTSPYPSDVALMVEAPIFHCNGDDPEAVVYAAKVATEFRQKFGKDVVIDMFCYRRNGHNEGDDPTVTSPLMYAAIKDHPSTQVLYAKRLIEEGITTQAEVDGWIAEFYAFLDTEIEAGKTYQADKADWLDGQWKALGVASEDDRRGDTGVSEAKLKDISAKLTAIPNRINIHKTVKRVIEQRRDAVEKGEGIDWGNGEHLAFASLLDEGIPIRLTGQDSVRGTFSHRHSDIIDQTNEEHYTPLNNIRPDQGHYEVIDSALSEEAVLGFEYGFSLADPNTLTIWEAQFGDFANGAQVLFDQFISSGEQKWLRMSGLVCLLPHGYEGQGPEHSSARLERFLQMSAEDNWQVVNITTPANYFHALRRQMRRDFRKPMIVMTPKSLLRHKRAVSNLADFGTGQSFHRVMVDGAEAGCDVGGIKLAADDKISRVIICSGKVYYDLVERRATEGRNDVVLLRLEQLYPFPTNALSAQLNRFTNAEVIWCQEEPRNMGAWTFVDWWIEQALGRLEVKAKRARYVGRPASASTAVGQMKRHNAELEAFLSEAFAK
jgi:2-oxoglutarate dehydrogenase E1 component